MHAFPFSILLPQPFGGEGFTFDQLGMIWDYWAEQAQAAAAASGSAGAAPAAATAATEDGEEGEQPQAPPHPKGPLVNVMLVAGSKWEWLRPCELLVVWLLIALDPTSQPLVHVCPADFRMAVLKPKQDARWILLLQLLVHVHVSC